MLRLRQYSLLLGTNPTSDLDKNTINASKVWNENGANANPMTFKLYYSIIK